MRLLEREKCFRHRSASRRMRFKCVRLRKGRGTRFGTRRDQVVESLGEINYERLNERAYNRLA